MIFEALGRGDIALDDTVVVTEHAASMGGSQCFFEAGEEQTVQDMIKCIEVASGNDAAVAMAEHLAGSEAAFVQKMNERAKELGMEHTHFDNACGLEVETHLTSARDIAIMSRQLCFIIRISLHIRRSGWIRSRTRPDGANHSLTLRIRTNS